jgi:3-oxoacyl-[acyl-carrier-protein] synthase-3
MRELSRMRLEPRPSRPGTGAQADLDRVSSAAADHTDITPAEGSATVRVEGVYVRGHGVHLPARRRVAEAVASGECPAKLVSRTNIESVSVSPAESAPEMAVVAARAALDRADSAAQDVALVLHADTYYQGQDLWATASYIQAQALGNDCPAIELRQMSSGGLAAMLLATTYLAAAGPAADALLTTADRFCLPGVDRWRTDPGTPYADGGTALVLSRRGGYARLRSIVMHADPALESLHRSSTTFAGAPFEHGAPVDFEAAKRRFVAEHGLSYGVSRSVEGQRHTVKRALADADLELGEARWVVLPHFGWRRLESNYLRPFDIDASRTTWEWSRTVGHLGAGDQFAGLGHLLDAGKARPGDRCVLIGVGAGYTWGCAVLEILDPARA